MNPARRAYVAYSQDRWQKLMAAHAHLAEGQVQTGLEEFRASLHGLNDLLNGDGIAWPPVSRHPIEASASSAVIFLRDFYQLTKTWQTWPTLARPVRQSAGYSALPALVRGHIEAGWAVSHAGVMPLDQLIGGLDQALRGVAHDNSRDGRWSRLALHLAASELNNRAFRHSASISHGVAAVELAATLNSAYYRIRAYEELGTAHYNLGTVDDNADQYDACMRFYNAGDDIVADIGREAWSMGREYGKGWLFNKLHDYEQAVAHFERGALRRTGAGLLYDAGRCYYGMGFSLLMLKNHAGARIALNRALDLFSDDDHAQMNQDALGVGSRSPQMSALVLQIMGLVDQDEGDLPAALENLELSMEHMKSLTNPGPKFDTLMPLIEVCEAIGDTERLKRYQTQLAELRAAYDLPKFL